MNIRKIILYLSVSIIVIVGGILGYFYWVGSQPEAALEGTLQIKKIVDVPVVSPVVGQDGKNIWFGTAEGKIFKVQADGFGLTEVPAPKMIGSKLKNILWSQASGDFIAISQSPESEIDLKNYFDPARNQYIPLARNMLSLDWMSDDKRIALVWQSADQRSQQLVVANGDGSGYSVLTELPWPDLIIKASPKNNEALLLRFIITGEINKIYKFSLEDGQYRTLVETGQNTAVKWLPSGTHFIYSQTQDDPYDKLFIYAMESGVSSDLKISSSVDRVAFDPVANDLYAAVSNEDQSGDVIVKLDLDTLSQEVFFTPSDKVTIKHLDFFEGGLYFVNAADNKLYSISK